MRASHTRCDVSHTSLGPCPFVVSPKPIWAQKACLRMSPVTPPVLCHAESQSGNGGDGRDPAPVRGSSPEEALAVAQRVVDLCRGAEKDAIINFLPEALVERCLQRSRARGEGWNLRTTGGSSDPGSSSSSSSNGDIGLDQLLSCCTTEDFPADAFAYRGLLLAPPKEVTMLSTLRLSPERCLQRCAVSTASGEDMVLVLDLQLEDALAPRYRSLQLVKQWILCGVTGEAATPELPAIPQPCHGPEAVVAAQLQALRQEDAPGVFTFASPSNQAAFGRDVEFFARMLGSDAYRPLLGHLKAEVLRSVQVTPDKALITIGVTSNRPSPGDGAPMKAAYHWVVGLQGEEAGALAGCWMTETVQRISAEGMRPW